MLVFAQMNVFTAKQEFEVVLERLFTLKSDIVSIIDCQYLATKHEIYTTFIRAKVRVPDPRYFSSEHLGQTRLRPELQKLESVIVAQNTGHSLENGRSKV